MGGGPDIELVVGISGPFCRISKYELQLIKLGQHTVSFDTGNQNMGNKLLHFGIVRV